ncbi:hypothetical protein SAMN05445871_3115 [Paraburkholderia caballeronis]|uniref:Uncharacterized protein n=1 Tax=Paraburkholderia caballeronis TaxID=416943 RepID=A0A1H7I585_9BURK|nr:hypothetical protein C7403_10170 [Paraburkholderia caballeronis]PXX04478.1 hypothetical protein C7407_10170 [Paraburkholderia caballeronis]RAK05539.1 hypothetical protein C7409_10170 [Paraburkholderia caballeronis]TDV36947.1 hypothetical protein C7405_10372 [Paraburkholderia caballeronis]SEC91877.1 hypothetical protein SAMN05445871_3115 [Paraburkholderia caballeronis]
MSNAGGGGGLAPERRRAESHEFPAFDPANCVETNRRSSVAADQAFDSAFSDSLIPSDTPVPAGTFLIAASASFSE